VTIRETAEDRVHEQEVVDVLAPIWHCEFARFPIARAPFDFIAHRGGVALSLVEVKCRTRLLAGLPFLWINAHKWYDLREHANVWEVRPLYVARFRDAIAWVDLHTVDVTSPRVTGRKDRGDPDDLDLALRIPREHCNVIPLPAQDNGVDSW
jgi:Holliday junction resolvase-like predicted endonuclease